MRLVKRTVNFDDPGTYHLYYGDERGHPGTVLTFFPWEHAVKGSLGVGETQETAFRVPALGCPARASLSVFGMSDLVFTLIQLPVAVTRRILLA